MNDKEKISDEYGKFLGQEVEIFKYNQKGEMKLVCKGILKSFNFAYGHCILRDDENKYFIRSCDMIKRKRNKDYLIKK